MTPPHTSEKSKPVPGQTVAVIGSGVSGLVAAYLLAGKYRVSVIEARPRLGGHAHTVDIEVGGRSVAVDTGFIVFNDRTYPTFCRVLERLGVASRQAPMTFGVTSERSGTEYAVTSINSLFADRRNLLRPRYMQFLCEVTRWNKLATRCRGAEFADVRLSDFLAQHRFSQRFIDDYLIPLGSSIWSCETERLLAFPVQFLAQFFHNHGMLAWADHPQWRTVTGGSRTYVDAIAARPGLEIRLAQPVRTVRRSPDGVELTFDDGVETFDHTIIACHADQSLALLEDPSATERELLGAFRFQNNTVTLHCDEQVLPRRTLARAAWNYRVSASNKRVSLTYDMRRLQSIDVSSEVLVTLNGADSVRDDFIYGQWQYAHPLYTVATARAQARHGEAICANRTSYCGAYWRFGFHEDGAASAARVCEAFGVSL